MIIDTFDDKSEAIINPILKENREHLDICLINFSNVIEEYIVKKYNPEIIAYVKCANGKRPIYKIDYNGKKIGYYKSYIGAPACTGMIETMLEEVDVDKFLLFGGAGCLDKEIAHGKIMIPQKAYRDEGTSYHYMKASDYVDVKNHEIVKAFMEENKIPHIEGKTWTTDSFYRETKNNFEKHKNDGCISVEMECAGVQAMCDFRNLELYVFFNSGDLLDAPEWDERHESEEYSGTQHDCTFLKIAIKLADYILGE